MCQKLRYAGSVWCKHIRIIAIITVFLSTLTIVQLQPKEYPLQNHNLHSTESIDQHRIAERLDRLYAGCYEFHTESHAISQLGPSEPNPYEFFINRKHNLIWCKVYKAASSTWLHNFNVMAGYKPAFLRQTNIDRESLARRRYPRPTIDQLRTAQNDSITFLIARHPFERLVSAYRDKFLSDGRSEYFARLGSRIVKQFRRVRVSSTDVVIDSNRPSFGEFVAYVLDGERRGVMPDEHWTPIANLCTPCSIRFDIIVEFETMAVDVQYFMNLTDLSASAEIVPQWLNKAGGRPTADISREFFGQLSSNQIGHLFEMFRYDFKFFGYDLNGYA